jgi:hypothetical protein
MWIMNSARTQMVEFDINRYSEIRVLKDGDKALLIAEPKSMLDKRFLFGKYSSVEAAQKSFEELLKAMSNANNGTVYTMPEA